MLLRAGTVESKLLGIIELCCVSVGGTPQKKQMRVGRYRHSGLRGVGTYMSVMAAEGRLLAQGLFDERNQ